MDQTNQFTPPQETSLTKLPVSAGSLPMTQKQTSTAAYAAERAQMMFGCYRKGDANDPETYTAAVAAILSEYSPEVVQRVTDPRTGIPRRMKFMPNPAEVAEACDNAKASIKAEKILAQKGWRWNGSCWERAA